MAVPDFTCKNDGNGRDLGGGLDMIRFNLEGEYIKLDQLLKAVGIADSGGQAKHLISIGMVKVNQVQATERGKKIRSGDEVVCDREVILVE